MPSSKNEFLIFLHIQKTGGITLQRMLRQKYGPSLPKRAIKVLAGQGQPLPLEASLKGKKMRDRYFAGHVCFGVHRLLPKPYHYVTILREPVSRIISLYDFSKSNSGAFYHGIASKVSLEEFALHTGLRELDNGQTRFIAGDAESLFINQTPFGQCNTALLEKAQKNTEKHFSMVGFTDQFDRSMLLLSKIMGWKEPHYLRLNSSKQKTSVPETLKARIAAHNSLDVELYRQAQAQFSKALEKYDITQADVDKFQAKNKQLNATFAGPYKAYHQTKSILRGQANRP